jgi:manganese/zinc/iron transport system permease protein
MGIMITLAAIFGAISGIAGAIISSSAARIPTGPTIVLCISIIVVVSITLAPNRGIIWNWIRQNRNRKKLQGDAVLCDLYQLALQHGDLNHTHEEATLDAMSVSGGRGAAAASLRELEQRGLARRLEVGRWAITQQGFDQAEKMRESIGRRD